MTATRKDKTQDPERDWTKHRYELCPIIEGQYLGHQIVGDYARDTRARTARSRRRSR